MPFASRSQPLRGKDRELALALVKQLEQQRPTDPPFFDGFVIHARIDRRGLEIAERTIEVDRVRINKPMQALFLDQARAISGVAPFHNSMPPYLGSGEEIMIIDAGFDPTNPVLQRVGLIELCAPSSQSKCRNTQGVLDDILVVGPGSSAATPPPTGLGVQPAATTAIYHGTAVASIAAGLGGQPFPNGQQSILGFAPSATLILANVQGHQPTNAAPNSSANGSWQRQFGEWRPNYWGDAIIKALEWANTRAAQQIAAGGLRLRTVNMSFGTVYSSFNSCSSRSDFNTIQGLLAELVAKGVVPVAGSGNEPSGTHSFPSCTGQTFTAGASCNTIFSYPNCQNGQFSIAPFVTLGPQGQYPQAVAPGSTVTTTTSSFTAANQPLTHFNGLFDGTSSAAPMLSACMGLIANRLVATGNAALWNYPRILAALTVSNTAGGQAIARATATKDSLPARPITLLDCNQGYVSLTTQNTAIDPSRFGLTGTYFSYSTQGQGFVFEVAPPVPPNTPSKIYGGWFSYKNDVLLQPGQGQHWYGISEEGDRTGFVVPIGIYEQRFSNQPAFNSPNIGTHQPTKIGSGTLTFRSCEFAELYFQRSVGVSADSLPQASGTIVLQRLGASPECANNTQEQEYIDQTLSQSVTPTALPFALTGVWGRATATGEFDPAFSGQGLMLEVFNGAITSEQPLSIGWYTYNGVNGAYNAQCPGGTVCPPPVGEGPAANGVPALYSNRYRWLTVQPWTPSKTTFPLPVSSARDWSGGIYITAGGLFNAGSPSPNTKQVGKFRIRFLKDAANPQVECNQAEVRYEFYASYNESSTDVRGFSYLTGLFSGFPTIQPPIPPFQTGDFRIKRIFPARSGCQLP